MGSREKKKKKEVIIGKRTGRGRTPRLKLFCILIGNLFTLRT